MKNTKQVRTRAVRARQSFEDLLSVSSRHREHVLSRQHTEDVSIPSYIRDTRDQRRRQADYERRLRSSVLTVEERQDIIQLSRHYYWSQAVRLLRYSAMLMASRGLRT